MTLVCPYCRTEVAADDAARVICQECNTPHHADCWAENGGCTLFGCKLAPPDEPKVQVSSNELTSAAAAPGTVAVRPNLFGDANASAVSYAVAPTMAAQAPPPPPPPPTPAPPGADLSPSLSTAPTVRQNTPGYAAPGGIFASVSASGEPVRPPKSRIAFVMLGIFFGALGLHNFYAGYIKRGVLQACISLLTLGYASVISWIWALVEVCTVDRDAYEIHFL